MGSRLMQRALLIVASATATASGQGFIPPPNGAVPMRWNEGTSFPLPENATSRLTQPFRSTSDPDWKVVRLMAELSFLAYDNSFPSVANRLRLFDLSLGSFTTVDHHHAISGWDPKTRVLVIAFRGTDISQLADVWTDLDYETKETQVGNVHRGFYLATNALLGGIHYEIKRRKPLHVWITGHSLGGAMATICLAELDRLNVPVSGVVTFGQPRVGDKEFTEQLNQRLGSRILRVINERDIVASLPPYIPWRVPRYYSGGSVIQFLGGELVRSSGVQMMARPDINEHGEIVQGYTVKPDGEDDAPRGPAGEVPPDPEQLTEEEYREFQAILDDDGRLEVTQHGAPVGGILDRFNLKERAGQHSMHLYIQNVERFAAEGK